MGNRGGEQKLCPFTVFVMFQMLKSNVKSVFITWKVHLIMLYGYYLLLSIYNT